MGDTNKKITVTAQLRDEVSAATNTMGANMVSSMKQAALGFGVAMVSVQAFKQVVVDSIGSAIEEERQINRLNAVLSRHRDVVHSSASTLSNWAESQMRVTGIADDAYRSALSLSIALGRTEDEAKNLATTAADTSVVLGRDMGGVVDALNKSYGGNLRELRMLIPELGNLSDEALRSGGAIDALRKIFGGGAAEANVGLPGQLRDTANATGELKEAFGGLLLEITGSDISPWIRFLDAWRYNLEQIAKYMKDIKGDWSWLSQAASGPLGIPWESLQTPRRKAEPPRGAGNVVDIWSMPKLVPPNWDTIGRTPQTFVGGREIARDLSEAARLFLHSAEFTRQNQHGMWEVPGGPRGMGRGGNALDDYGKGYWESQAKAIDKQQKSLADAESERYERALTFNDMLADSFAQGFSSNILAGQAFFDSVGSGFRALGEYILRMLVEIMAKQAITSILSLAPGGGQVVGTEVDSVIQTGANGPQIVETQRRSIRARGYEAALSRSRGYAV